MKYQRPFLIFFLTLIIISPVHAVTVDPSGVNVRQSGPTTVFLTFRGLSNQVPMEGLWCGAINPDNSCVPGTIFGRLPARSNFSTLSGSNNFTDIMTIPSSVTRRAYQDALRGNPSQFFYVRRFMSQTGGSDEFVPVTCRMAGGGARSPLALVEVRMSFQTDKPVILVPRGEPTPPFGAEIIYNGSGRLKGRWEVVLPGDVQPTTQDLLTEASLPIEDRPFQRRYTQIDRFDIFLPPTGKIYLRGPNPDKLPRDTDGLHLILFRVEASDDKESRSDTGAGTVRTGGVAGFPMPVLRYYVGKGEKVEQLTETTDGKLQLIVPFDGSKLSTTQSINFTWTKIADTALYKIEVHDDEHTIITAYLDSDVFMYTPPPWIKDHVGKKLRWHVEAIGSGGKPIAKSKWRDFTIQK